MQTKDQFLFVNMSESASAFITPGKMEFPNGETFLDGPNDDNSTWSIRTDLMIGLHGDAKKGMRNFGDDLKHSNSKLPKKNEKQCFPQLSSQGAT